MSQSQITMDDFLRVDIRVGTVVEAEEHKGARKPAIKLKVDFGPEIGILTTSARILKYHSPPEAIIGQQIAGIVNFPSRQIGKVKSEFLLLGFPDPEGDAVIVTPIHKVANGGRLF